MTEKDDLANSDVPFLFFFYRLFFLSPTCHGKETLSGRESHQFRALLTASTRGL